MKSTIRVDLCRDRKQPSFIDLLIIQLQESAGKQTSEKIGKKQQHKFSM